MRQDRPGTAEVLLHLIPFGVRLHSSWQAIASTLPPSRSMAASIVAFASRGCSVMDMSHFRCSSFSSRRQSRVSVVFPWSSRNSASLATSSSLRHLSSNSAISYATMVDWSCGVEEGVMDESEGREQREGMGCGGVERRKMWPTEGRKNSTSPFVGQGWQHANPPCSANH